MGKNPKFMVFHLKELIYTLIFVILGIILIVALVLMFKGKDTKSEETSASGKYQPGVYTSNVTLNGNPMDIKIALDNEHINSITIDNVSENIATMYPLVQPAFEDIAKQIVSTQSLENIHYEEGKQYTYTILMEAISKTIKSATVK